MMCQFVVVFASVFRCFETIFVRKSAGESMKTGPVTIEATELASAALQIMEERKITALFIVDEAKRVEGIIHIHDLWGLELF